MPDLLRTLGARTARPEPVATPDLPASIPGYEQIDAKIEEARQELTAFTASARELEQALDGSTPGARQEIGPTLDQARAWATYLAPEGAMGRAIPSEAPAAISIRYLTQIAAFQRLAQQWVDYLQAAQTPLPTPGQWGQQQPAPQADGAAEEQSCQRQIHEGAQQVNAQTMAFTLNSSNMNSYQMQSAINDLNSLLARLQSLRPATNRLLSADRPACSQQLEGVIGTLQDKLGLCQSILQRQRTFEASQGFAPRPIPPLW